jgi:hypothetical protein
VISHLLLGKWRPQTPVNILGRSNYRIKSYGLFEPVHWTREQRPSPHRVANPHLMQGKRRPKLLYKFEGNPTVGSKLRPFRTGTLVSSPEISASPSSDSTSTARTTASGNSCINLRAIQRSDQKLRPFRTGTLVSSPKTSASPSSDSTSTL